MLVSSTPSGPWSTCNNAHTINCTNPFSTFVTTTGPQDSWEKLSTCGHITPQAMSSHSLHSKAVSYHNFATTTSPSLPM